MYSKLVSEYHVEEEEEEVRRHRENWEPAVPEGLRWSGELSGDQQPLSQVEEGDYSDLVVGQSINQVKDIHNQAAK